MQEGRIGYASSGSRERDISKMKQVHVSYIMESHPNEKSKNDHQIQGIKGRITIQWRDDAESCHTCGWLLSEFLRSTEPSHIYNSGHSEAKTITEYSTIAIKSLGS